MKRFWLFYGTQYYPAGGMGDFKGDFDSLHEALVHVLKKRDNPDWVHVYDTLTRQVVFETPEV